MKDQSDKLTRSAELAARGGALFQKRAKLAQERFAERLREACEAGRESVSAHPATPVTPWTLWQSGYEYAVDFLPGLFWKSEYRYSSFRAADVPLSVSALGVTVVTDAIHSQKYVQTIRSELVYRFNWGGGAVVAKY